MRHLICFFLVFNSCDLPAASIDIELKTEICRREFSEIESEVKRENVRKFDFRDEEFKRSANVVARDAHGVVDEKETALLSEFAEELSADGSPGQYAFRTLEIHQTSRNVAYVRFHTKGSLEGNQVELDTAMAATFAAGTFEDLVSGRPVTLLIEGLDRDDWLNRVEGALRTWKAIFPDYGSTAVEWLSENPIEITISDGRAIASFPGVKVSIEGIAWE